MVLEDRQVRPEKICLPPIVDGAPIDEWLIPSMYSPDCKDMIPDDWTEYVKAPQWISVQNRLPGKGVMVLVYRPDAHLSHDPHYTLDMYTGIKQKDPQGNYHEFGRWCRPSHWMPLPEPPDRSEGE